LLTKVLVESDPEEAEDNFDEIKMTIETGLKPIGCYITRYMSQMHLPSPLTISS